MAEKNSGHIYSVSHLTREIKSLLEDRFPFIWVTGEISNYAVPASGHSYFSLKDANAVISCVMFKGQKRNLKFVPENGLKVIGLGRLSLYEPRGSYQLIFEHMEPEGAGSLQVAFEQLKKMLAEEGLFDTIHKQDIPFLPAKVNLITSPTGAAVRDIIHIAKRRFPKCCLEIVPVKVQGQGADTEIVHAIDIVNRLERSDVIILARGGGSMEDLSAFNAESVARAIFDSRIPVITGIGHETDFTIADFVADLRAPTPSAAAELALPEYAALTRQVGSLTDALLSAMTQRLDFLNQRLDDLQNRLKSPAQVVSDYKIRLGDYRARLAQTLSRQVAHSRDRLSWCCQGLLGAVPETAYLRQDVTDLERRLTEAMKRRQSDRLNRVRELAGTLEALNPASVLERGYSITRTMPGKRVILDADDVEITDAVEIILSKGRIHTRVERKINAEKDI